MNHCIRLQITNEAYKYKTYTGDLINSETDFSN